MIYFNILNSESERERERVNSARKFFNSYQIKTATIFFCVGFLFFAHSASAATYYVWANGGHTACAASDKTAAQTNSQATAFNMTGINACSGANALTDGDQVLFSSQGSSFTSSLVVPSGGSGVETKITYTNVPTETPTITLATYPMLNTNSKSNINIIGFSLVYTGAYNVSAYGISPTGSNVTFQNLSIDMGNGGAAIRGGTASISNILIDTIAILHSPSTFYGSISIYGTSGSNITVKNIIGPATGACFIGISNASNATVTNASSIAGVRFTSVTTGSISTITAISSLSGANNSLWITDSSGVTVSTYLYSGNDYMFMIDGASTNITISDFSASGGALVGTLTGTANNITLNSCNTTNSGGFSTSSGSHDITFNNCTLSGTIGNGFLSTGTSYNITYNNCIADNGNSIGFIANTSAHDITYNKCEASYNGAVNVTTNGGGFLPHNSTTNIVCNYCIAHHNYNQGFGDVSSGTNYFYNSVNWGNGYAVGDVFKGSTVTTPSVRGDVYYGKTTDGNLTVENGVFGGGKPREIDNEGPSYTTLNYNLYQPLDNSKFYNTTDNENNTSWSTYHATKELNSNNADPLFTNGSGIYSTDTDFQLSYLSSAIDAGTDVGLTTDYAGNSIYGTPDIGAYEYQPPYTIGTDEVDVNAEVRVYADGKFRNIGTAGGTTADLTITPTSGSFTSDTSAWMDVTDITWNTTGDYSKQWTESSTFSGLTNTVHTIGDLEANTYYNITVDSSTTNLSGTNCNAVGTNYVCLSNSSGEIIFTYQGTYSTHTFDVIASDTGDQITLFNLVTPSTIGNVNQTEHRVSLTVARETNITNLTPTIALSTGATVLPTSGTATDFTKPVTYTVTAENGLTQAYIVIVNHDMGGGSSYTPITTPTANLPQAPIVVTQPQTQTQPQIGIQIQIAQIRQQLISLITQLIQMLYLEVEQMRR